ncbi:glycosyltransferase family 4 protein [uncultured Synechococcus sp.]|uniref:glycosyltransferase family 4 protein n=1 Tax=uncultured Synechococcus sp. TaxID=154535 RepID=UPI002592CF71|nr:glycosyltransferase family 4 protein [uncultured Synechococcus sp.]
MKLLLISYNLRRQGGIERLGLDVIEALQLNGHQVVVIYTKNIGAGRSGRLVGQLLFLVRLAIASRRCDQLFSMHALLLSQVEWLLPRRLPRLCWLHGVEVWGKALVPLAPALKRCKRLFASSSFTRDRLIYTSGGPWPEITVLNPVARLWENSAIAAHRPAEITKGLRLLTVARMAAEERYKGHDLVLQALNLLKVDLSKTSWHWKIVGNGNDRLRLEELTAKLDLNNNIDFVGALDDDALRAAYLNCNLLVMPSSYSVSVDGRASGEGFGITYLEAALAGRASIACCHGGQTDLISDGETGWLVEPNAEALAKVLREVLENPEQLRHRGNAAIQLAKVNFGFIPFRLALENALYD